MNLITYATLYHIYKLPLSRIMRIIFVLMMSAICVMTLYYHQFPKGPLFFLSLFFMVEVLYRFKILKTTPKITIQKNTKDIYRSFTMQAIDAFFFSPDIQGILKTLLQAHTVRFLLYKANISPKEFTLQNFTKEA